MLSSINSEFVSELILKIASFLIESDSYFPNLKHKFSTNNQQKVKSSFLMNKYFLFKMDIHLKIIDKEISQNKKIIYFVIFCIFIASHNVHFHSIGSHIFLKSEFLWCNFVDHIGFNVACI
jgi:hypothetical protein